MFRFLLMLFLLSVLIQAKVQITDSVDTYPEGSPEHLTTLALKYTTEENWKAYAEILDSDDLKIVKSIFNYLVSKDTTDEILKEFNFKGSKDSFYNVSQIEFFPMFMSFIYKIQPQLSSALGSISSKVIGTVPEGNLSHVLTRKKVESAGINYEQLEIITVIHKDNKIFIKMKDNIKAFAEQLKKLLGNE